MNLKAHLLDDVTDSCSFIHYTSQLRTGDGRISINRKIISSTRASSILFFLFFSTLLPFSPSCSFFFFFILVHRGKFF